MRFFRFVFYTIALSFFVHLGYSQGCVAIRGFSGTGANSLQGNFNLQKGDLFLQNGYRYFKSFRHFRGDHEEAYRLEQGTEVINHSHFIDVSLNYGISDRLFASVTLPLVFHNRSSMYEHGGNPPNGLGERHETSSSGLSDMRLGVGYWLIDPAKSKPYNYSVGLGLKLPTGKYDYTDTFYNQGDNRDQNIDGVVDQSIQPGDGGTGVTLELQGFHTLSNRLQLSTNLFYLFNMTETNGVLTRRGTSEFSSPDQYVARLGAFYQLSTITGLSSFLGGRIEGVPAEDLIGGSAGYRRPGYVVSVEPGFNYSNKNMNISMTVPVALIRNRTQSYQDKQRTADTGVYAHGDAAFADYVVNVSVSFFFGSKNRGLGPNVKGGFLDQLMNKSEN